MAGFRQSPRQLRKAQVKRVKGRAKELSKNLDSEKEKERVSREAAKKALDQESKQKDDFAAVLAERELRYIKNRKAFFGGSAQAQRMEYIDSVFSAAFDDFNANGSLVSFAAAVGPTLIMMHRTGGIRNGLSEAWHLKLADQVKPWAEADPERYGAFYAKCEAYREGARLPYDAHTAALDCVALDARHYEAIRKPGLSDAERARITDRYEKDKADLGAIIEADGINPRDLVDQQHKLVATLVVRDPKYAAMYGICPGSKEYQEAVQATGAEFGPKGEAAAPVKMHAANKDLDWPAGKYMEPKSVKSLDYYQETMRTGVAAFEPGFQNADKNLRAAVLNYWAARMTSDGISKSRAEEAAWAAYKGEPKIEAGAEAVKAPVKTPFSGLRDRAMAAWTAFSERMSPKYTAMAPVIGKREFDYVMIGGKAVDLISGKAAPEDVKAENAAQRDWAHKGGLREYFSASEARMTPEERKSLFKSQVLRADNDPAFSERFQALSSTSEGRDQIVRDGMLQKLREMLPDTQKKAVPESFLNNEDYERLRGSKERTKGALRAGFDAFMGRKETPEAAKTADSEKGAGFDLKKYEFSSTDRLLQKVDDMKSKSEAQSEHSSVGYAL